MEETPIEILDRQIPQNEECVKDLETRIARLEFCKRNGMKHPNLDKDIQSLKLHYIGSRDELKMLRLEKMIRVFIRDKKIAPIKEVIRKKYNDQCAVLLDNLEEFGHIKKMTEGMYLDLANILKNNREVINALLDESD
jgi:hypothetical protein